MRASSGNVKSKVFPALARRVVHFAGAPLYSQICFSLAVLFTTAMLSRTADVVALSAILTCYAIQSVSMAWGRQALVVARVQRYSDNIFSNDLRQILIWSWRTALFHLVVSFLLAIALTGRWSIASAAAAWVSTSVFIDIWRFAGARFDTRMRRHSWTTTAQLSFSCIFYLVGSGSVSVITILIVTSASNCAFAAIYFLQLRACRNAGVSWFSTAHGRFARNFGFETAGNALLQSTATVLLTSISPGVAVGVLLVYQVIGTPTGMVSQALSASLGRIVRDKMTQQVIPVRVLLIWLAILGCGTVSLAFYSSGLLNATLIKVFGENWNETTNVLWPLALYFCSMYSIQVVSIPTRWWIDSRVLRNWMVGAVCVFYCGLLLAATVFLNDLTTAAFVAALCYLAVSGTRVLISYVNRPESYRWVF